MTHQTDQQCIEEAKCGVNSMVGKKVKRIAIVFSEFRHLYGEGGGLQRNRWNLAMEFLNRGFELDLLGFNPNGIEYIPKIAGLNTFIMKQHGSLKTKLYVLKYAPRDWRSRLLQPVGIPLKVAHPLRRLPSVISYLHARNPDILIGGGTQANLCIMLAKAGIHSNTRIVLSEHNLLSYNLTVPKHIKSWRWRYLPPLLRKAYLAADGLVAVSQALADNLEKTLNLPQKRVRVIYNPVVDNDLKERIKEQVDHPWLNDSVIPVLLNVARLVKLKDQETLLRAFALARSKRPMRLIILGNGPEYERLQMLSQELNIADDVEIPGFEPNPLRFMARADAFVLTSKSEGFGNVLVEAMAAGCQVISTNCLAGPAEILDNGKYGKLVEVGNPDAVCRGILETLENPTPKKVLENRARFFTADRAANEYLKAAGIMRE